MKVIYIEWLDARGIQGRLSKKEANSNGLMLVHTAGILVGEDEEVVRVAQDYWTYEDGDGTMPEVYRDLEVIAKIGIQRRVEWETKPPSAPSDKNWNPRTRRFACGQYHEVGERCPAEEEMMPEDSHAYEELSKKILGIRPL